MLEAIDNYLRYLLRSYDLIQVAIELLLIGFVVWAVMRFLRGTGGEKLFKGIVFVLLGFWAVSLAAGQLNLDLERIDWLFTYFLGAVLLVSMIAFQPELRRGLMRLGGTRFGRSGAPEMANIIEQVVDAAAYLSRTHIGALIAIEREVGLGDLVAGGTKLNAKVSAELLNTIFWPGTPLHDMGVVIRNGRIAAAGVQFPLAEHGEYDRMLGSRHRSAIGLSKETDAVLVVISEETGQIAVALDGKLNRYLTLEQLHHQLVGLLLPVSSKQMKPQAVKATTPPAADQATRRETTTPSGEDQVVTTPEKADQKTRQEV